MKFFAAAIALMSVAPAISALVANTPTGVVTCQPILLTFGSGTAPYYVSIIPGGQVSATPYRVWDPTNAESLTWLVDIPAGTAFSVVVKDATGAQAYSDRVNTQSGSDTSCLGSASSSVSGASASAATRAASTGANASTSGGSPAAQGAGATTAATAKPAASQSASSNTASGGTIAASSGGFRLSSAAYGVLLGIAAAAFLL